MKVWQDQDLHGGIAMNNSGHALNALLLLKLTMTLKLLLVEIAVKSFVWNASTHLKLINQNAAQHQIQRRRPRSGKEDQKKWLVVRNKVKIDWEDWQHRENDIVLEFIAVSILYEAYKSWLWSSCLHPRIPSALVNVQWAYLTLKNDCWTVYVF